MKPRLLISTKSFWPSIGGAEEAARVVAHAVSDEFDVTVLAVGARQSGYVERQGGITVVKTGLAAYRMSTPLSFGYVSAFNALVRRADIIHVHSPHPLGELAVAISRTTAEIVASYHFDVVRQRTLGFVYGPLLRRSLGKARGLICSNPNVVHTSPVLSRFTSKITIIPYGVDLREFVLTPEEAAEVQRIRAGRQRPIALFVGRLVYYKGLEYLLRATAETDVDLLVIGDGALASELAGLAAELRLGQRVSFIPQMSRERLRLYFRACDFLVLPSVARSEFFGIVLLEAMACGKPVITTELGTGTSWVNRDGETGLVVPPRDPGALAQAMRELCAKPGLARRLGDAGLRRVAEEFSMSKFVDAHLRVYRSLLRTKL
jgi:rhamnosyl/mannosyltransferase